MWTSAATVRPAEEPELPTITEQEVRNAASRRTRGTVTASAILNESARTASPTDQFDVFLSHSIRDAELVLGVKAFLENQGLRVYVDWIVDPSLDRTKVTAATAEKLRRRMQHCTAMVYMHTSNSPISKWMPWELGYFDGYHGAVAILPITTRPEPDFVGQEYLGLYPWVEHGYTLNLRDELRVHRSGSDYRRWNQWVSSPRTFRKAA
jgi:hypothetical protein